MNALRFLIVWLALYCKYGSDWYYTAYLAYIDILTGKATPVEAFWWILVAVILFGGSSVTIGNKD